MATLNNRIGRLEAALSLPRPAPYAIEVKLGESVEDALERAGLGHRSAALVPAPIQGLDEWAAEAARSAGE